MHRFPFRVFRHLMCVGGRRTASAPGNSKRGPVFCGAVKSLNSHNNNTITYWPTIVTILPPFISLYPQPPAPFPAAAAAAAVLLFFPKGSKLPLAKTSGKEPSASQAGMTHIPMACKLLVIDGVGLVVSTSGCNDHTFSRYYESELLSIQR